MNNESNTVLATPNPGPAAVTGAAGIAAVLGWGATVLGAKWGMPPEVVGSIIGVAFTGLTTLWHRFFGPAVSVQKPS